ncbi:helix-turn-helix domain-containing protein [Paracidovorax wautersii]|uniref:DNA-binding transcriptional ArsR family regulator n=1 Tax=Paracidovorax wautersii TaxID=1177982 RepID=A0ABU1IFB6_9BURK|nr:helix-turn-helix domain-containing protein [Paracidovorax wautersii]MDR6215910.1 DNA-binding transcriptional ArsR family regulator [Paracidovorax wautersii]
MNTNRIAHVAALVGEPARTAMLMALMDGRALTACELADAAHITPATASRHLGLLVEAQLLQVERQGRHRYHRLASPEVARVLEGLMQLAVPSASSQAAPRRVVVGPRDAALRLARTCYDHLAGRLGVALAGHLLEEGAVVFDGEGAAQVTDRAGSVLQRLGIDIGAAAMAAGQAGKRPQCRPCLDWSERRPHLAGRLGALICQHSLDSGWLLRGTGTRALSITPRGAVALRDGLGHARWAEVAGG